ncbi:f-box only protein [Anaeramoeba flamelloides]|uniref:F-box only protein n=1 Tax=Anaeramoeba flamelloides TaxID=1746091 RepID=A0ABQ8ZFA3_9EUKA|nr:f-box only protein [Anaeramoeba flamelloides]
MLKNQTKKKSHVNTFLEMEPLTIFQALQMSSDVVLVEIYSILSTLISYRSDDHLSQISGAMELLNYLAKQHSLLHDLEQIQWHQFIILHPVLESVLQSLRDAQLLISITNPNSKKIKIGNKKYTKTEIYRELHKIIDKKFTELHSTRVEQDDDFFGFESIDDETFFKSEIEDNNVYEDENGYNGNFHLKEKRKEILEFETLNGIGTGKPDPLVVIPEPNIMNGEFRTFGEALRHAKKGDIILIYPGTYYETIDVNVPVTFIGYGDPGQCEIHGVDKYTISVNCSGCKFKNLMIHLPAEGVRKVLENYTVEIRSGKTEMNYCCVSSQSRRGGCIKVYDGASLYLNDFECRESGSNGIKFCEGSSGEINNGAIVLNKGVGLIISTGKTMLINTNNNIDNNDIDEDYDDDDDDDDEDDEDDDDDDDNNSNNNRSSKKKKKKKKTTKKTKAIIITRIRIKIKKKIIKKFISLKKTLS